MLRWLPLVLLVFGCKKKEDDEGPFVEGAWRFAVDGAGTGTCSDNLARLFFGTTGGWDVTITATNEGFDAVDHPREGLFDGSGQISCDDNGTTYDCTMFEGRIPQGTLDADLIVYTDATLSFTNTRALEGLWSLDVECDGPACPQVASNYGISGFPCDWQQTFTGAYQPEVEE